MGRIVKTKKDIKPKVLSAKPTQKDTQCKDIKGFSFVIEKTSKNLNKKHRNR